MHRRRAKSRPVTGPVPGMRSRRGLLVINSGSVAEAWPGSARTLA
jgi:hypothetical protein